MKDHKARTATRLARRLFGGADAEINLVGPVEELLRHSGSTNLQRVRLILESVFHENTGSLEDTLSNLDTSLWLKETY